jgi:hypothetical protein
MLGGPFRLARFGEVRLAEQAGHVPVFVVLVLFEKDPGPEPIKGRIRMQRKNLFWVSLFLVSLAACDQPDADAPGSDQPAQNAPVDRDPTPQTGTGGESQSSSPDRTTTGAPQTPAEKPVQ